MKKILAAATAGICAGVVGTIAAGLIVKKRTINEDDLLREEALKCQEEALKYQEELEKLNEQLKRKDEQEKEIEEHIDFLVERIADHLFFRENLDRILESDKCSITLDELRELRKLESDIINGIDEAFADTPETDILIEEHSKMLDKLNEKYVN